MHLQLHFHVHARPLISLSCGTPYLPCICPSGQARQQRRDAIGLPSDVREGPIDFCCPILFERMADPVVASDGHTYEREASKGSVPPTTDCRHPNRAPEWSRRPESRARVRLCAALSRAPRVHA